MTGSSGLTELTGVSNEKKKEKEEMEVEGKKKENSCGRRDGIKGSTRGPPDLKRKKGRRSSGICQLGKTLFCGK